MEPQDAELETLEEVLLTPLVLQEVAKHCSHYTVLRCRLVCRTWRSVFSEVLTSKTVNLSISMAAKVSDFVRYVPSVFKNVKTLSITSEFQPPFEKLLEQGVTALCLLNGNGICDAPSFFENSLFPWAPQLKELRLPRLLLQPGYYNLFCNLTALSVLEVILPPRQQMPEAVSHLCSAITELRHLAELVFDCTTKVVEPVVTLLDCCRQQTQLRVVQGTCGRLNPTTAVPVLVHDLPLDTAHHLQLLQLTFRTEDAILKQVEYCHGCWQLRELACDGHLMSRGKPQPPLQQHLEAAQQTAPSFLLNQVTKLTYNCPCGISYPATLPVLPAASATPLLGNQSSDTSTLSSQPQSHPAGSSCPSAPPSAAGSQLQRASNSQWYPPLLLDLQDLPSLSSLRLTVGFSDFPVYVPIQGIPVTLSNCHRLVELTVTASSHRLFPDPKADLGPDICYLLQSLASTCPCLQSLCVEGDLKLPGQEALSQLTRLTKLWMSQIADPGPSPLFGRSQELHPAFLQPQWLPPSLEYLELNSLEVLVCPEDQQPQLSQLATLKLLWCNVEDLAVFAAATGLCVFEAHMFPSTNYCDMQEVRALFPCLLRCIVASQ